MVALGPHFEGPPKSSQPLPKILPKPSPNPPKTFPKASQIESKSMKNRKTQRKRHKLKKKQAWFNVPHPLGHHVGRPKPPKRGPRGPQNLPKWSPKREKIEVKKQVVFGPFFFIDFLRFWMVF